MVSRRKTCPLSEPGNASLPIPSFFPECNSPFRSHKEGLVSPIRNGQSLPYEQKRAPGQRIFPPPGWLQATKNLVFLDDVYQDRTLTGTCKREQTFLSHPRSISVSSESETSASLTHTFLKELTNFRSLFWDALFYFIMKSYLQLDEIIVVCKSEIWWTVPACFHRECSCLTSHYP